jgi:hypothetical protein
MLNGASLELFSIINIYINVLKSELLGQKYSGILLKPSTVSAINKS